MSAMSYIYCAEASTYGPEVEEENSRNTTRRKIAAGVLVLRRVRDLDVCSDVPHTEGAT